jgi:hypothetical protein
MTKSLYTLATFIFVSAVFITNTHALRIDTESITSAEVGSTVSMELLSSAPDLIAGGQARLQIIGGAFKNISIPNSDILTIGVCEGQQEFTPEFVCFDFSTSVDLPIDSVIAIVDIEISAPEVIISTNEDNLYVLANNDVYNNSGTLAVLGETDAQTLGLEIGTINTLKEIPAINTPDSDGSDTNSSFGTILSGFMIIVGIVFWSIAGFFLFKFKRPFVVNA